MSQIFVMSSPTRATPISNDITRIVKQTFKPPRQEPYKHEVIQARTTNNCKKHKDKNYWINNYYRRKANLQKGFLSSSSEPYKTVGELILDPYELVLSALPASENGKKDKEPKRRGTICEPDRKKIATDSQSEESESQKDSNVEKFELVDTCSTGGFNNMKQYLKECRLRSIAVKAGMPYEDHVRLMEELQKQEDMVSNVDANEMILPSVSDMYLSMSVSDKQEDDDMTPPAILVEEFYALSRSESRRSTVSPHSRLISPAVLKAPHLSPGPVTPASGSPTLQPNHMALLRINSGITQALNRKDRMFRDHFNYLESIFLVLMSLTNMKTKDLRSKVPLSKEYVKMIQKEIKHQPTDTERNSRATHMLPIRSTRDDGIESMTDHSTDKDRFSIFSAAKRITTLDSAKYSFGRRRSRNTSEFTRLDRPLVETWEDLLNVQPYEYKEDANSSPGFVLQAGIVTKFMKWFRRASVTPTQHNPSVQGVDREKLSMQLEALKEKTALDTKEMKTEKGDRDSHNHFYTHVGSAAGHSERVRKLPIWQQVAQEKSTVFKTNKKKKSRTKNPETTVLRCRHDLFKLKQSLQKENTAELEKLEREKVANFHLKYETLGEAECSPLYQQQIVRVHLATENADRSHLENFDIQPSKWYEELKESSLAMIANFDKPEIREMIQKLQKFSHMDNKTVPYAKAKLCLLMMSMPAYDICKIHEQMALKYVLEHILLGQEAQFEEWLSSRKMPYVILKN